jgi:hypothetical protein
LILQIPNQDLHDKSSNQQQENYFDQQIGLKFEEQIGKVL